MAEKEGWLKRLWSASVSSLEKPVTAWLVCLLLILPGAIVLLIFFQDWNANGKRNEAVRNLIFALGSVGALLGVWLASIRGKNFHRQVDAQTEQVRLEREQGRAETWSRCIEQLGNKDRAGTRIAGLRGLEMLARSNQDDAQFLEHICDILQDFVDTYAPQRDKSEHNLLRLLREIEHPPVPWDRNKVIQENSFLEPETSELQKWDECWQKHQKEVEHAIRAFASIVAMDTKIAVRLNLAHRYLPGLNLPYLQSGESSDYDQRVARATFPNLPINIDKSSLRESDFSGSFLLKATFRGSDLSKARLQEAYLVKADFGLMSKDLLKETDFSGADLRQARLRSVDLNQTIFAETKLQGAYLERAQFFEPVTLTNASVDGAHLKGAVYYENDGDMRREGEPVTKRWLKEKGVHEWSTTPETDA